MRMKRALLLMGSTRGITNCNFDLAMLDDIWMAWGFQVDFTYEPVL
jgi:hypothetical protein